MAQLMSVVARDGISINSVLREVRTLLLHLK